MILTTAATLFQTLPGTWALTRTISGSHRARIHGTAIWELQSTHSAQFHETVHNHIDNQTIEASASYLYKQTENLWQVYTQPAQQASQLLHTIDFNIIDAGPLMLAATPHFCGADRYHAYYDFNRPHVLCIVFTVHGPNKQYTSITELRKISA